MNQHRALARAALVAGAALAPLSAAAQADNTNSLTFPERLWTALFERTSEASEPRSPLDEALRRPGSARHEEGLSAAELAVLYGTFDAPDGADSSPQ